MRRNGFFDSWRESKELPTERTASSVAAQENFIRDKLRRMRGDGMQRPTTYQVINIVQGFRQQILLDNETIKSIIDDVWGKVERNPRKVKGNPEVAITEIPRLHEHQQQQDKARLTAAFIGHRLGNFMPVSTTDLSAGCERCGNTVTISGKTIAGLAVITKCIG